MRIVDVLCTAVGIAVILGSLAFIVHYEFLRDRCHLVGGVLVDGKCISKDAVLEFK